MDIILSKSAYKMLKIIYKEYLKRLKAGVEKDEAKLFNVGWENQLFPKHHIDDLHENLYELKNKLKLRLYINCTFKLSLDCIIYMEDKTTTRTKKIKKEILSLVKRCIPFIPSLMFVFSFGIKLVT